jgi:hypothetical protein
VLPQIGVYCMSKAAVVHMTKAMALEWGRFGINVNAICPGYIDTEINHHHWQTEQGQKLIQMLPRKRVGSPQDLDALIVMLCSTRKPFRQRRGDRGRRRLHGMKIEIPERKKLVYEMTIPIRWGDMDAMGHVNNTSYFRYMETMPHRLDASAGACPTPMARARSSSMRSATSTASSNTRATC